MEITVLQTDITNPDGRFLYSSNMLLNSIWDVALITPGFEYILTDTQEYYSYLGHWLKFRIPLPKDPGIVITQAHLKLYWEPRTSINLEGDGFIEIGVKKDDFDPINANQAYNRFVLSEKFDWDDTKLDRERSEQPYPLVTKSFHEAFSKATLEQADWQENDFVYIYLMIKDNNEKENKAWAFKSKSFNDDANFNPSLILRYAYASPSFTADVEVESEVNVSQFLECTAFIMCVSMFSEIEQDISTSSIFNRSITHDIDVTQEIQYIENVYDVVDTLYLEQDISLRQFDIQHTLSVSQTIQTNIIDLEHFLVVVSQITSPRVLSLDHLITPIQDWSYEDLSSNPAKPEDSVEVTQTITVTAVRSRTVDTETHVDQFYTAVKDESDSDYGEHG